MGKIGRKPDYRLAALNKETSEQNNIGVAWKNDDGSISIRLNAFIRLESNPDLVLSLFPNDEKPWPKKRKVFKPEAPSTYENETEDQAPF